MRLIILNICNPHPETYLRLKYMPILLNCIIGMGQKKIPRKMY